MRRCVTMSNDPPGELAFGPHSASFGTSVHQRRPPTSAPSRRKSVRPPSGRRLRVLPLRAERVGVLPPRALVASIPPPAVAVDAGRREPSSPRIADDGAREALPSACASPRGAGAGAAPERGSYSYPGGASHPHG